MYISLVERAAQFCQRRIDLRISKVPRGYAMSQLSSIRRLELYHPALRLSCRVWNLHKSSRSRREFELVAVVFVVIRETDMITQNSRRRSVAFALFGKSLLPEWVLPPGRGSRLASLHCLFVSTLNNYQPFSPGFLCLM